MLLEAWSGNDEGGTWTRERDRHNSTDPSSVALYGNSRAYLTMPHNDSHPWQSASFDKLRLRGQSLSFRVDLSTVGCGCNAAVYLVRMNQPVENGDSHYCDIMAAPPSRCLEIDLFEGNVKAARATLHTQAGEANDGTCNQYGCAGGMGTGPGGDDGRYGLGSSSIDSSRPFTVVATFDDGGHMQVVVRQESTQIVLWDMATSGNYPATQVPEEAAVATRDALEQGMVLAVSLWGTETSDLSGMSWLDGGCTARNAGGAYPHCDLKRARVVFSELVVAPPAPSPPTSPPAIVCESWCNEWTCYEQGTCDATCAAKCAGCSFCRR